MLQTWMGHECFRPEIFQVDLGTEGEYKNRIPMMVTFDIVEGESPLIVCLDVKQYADTFDIVEPPILLFHRATDTGERSFYTNTSKDNDLNDRIRFEIVPNG